MIFSSIIAQWIIWSIIEKDIKGDIDYHQSVVIVVLDKKASKHEIPKRSRNLFNMLSFLPPILLSSSW